MRSAFAEGLRQLARRELSEAQVRERLARADYAPPIVDEAIERLRACGALDDLRVAAAVARTDAQIKHRGRIRIQRRLAAIGIAPAVAARAVDEVFSGLDESAMMAQALARRLRGPQATVADAAQFRRLHQHLVRLGFPPDAVTRLLRRRARPGSAPDDEL
jgi:regulatory protein